MVDRKNFNTTKAPKMSEFFPQTVIAGDYIFLSGTAGLRPESGKIISDDLEANKTMLFKYKNNFRGSSSSLSKVFYQKNKKYGYSNSQLN